MHLYNVRDRCYPSACLYRNVHFHQGSGYFVIHQHQSGLGHRETCEPNFKRRLLLLGIHFAPPCERAGGEETLGVAKEGGQTY
jgi:hypothetical protein